MSRYIAAYDISHNAQRAKVAQLLSEYGDRIQFSVFEIDLEPDEIPLLQRRVGALLHSRDRFDLVPIDAGSRRMRLSWQRTAPVAEAVVFS